MANKYGKGTGKPEQASGRDYDREARAAEAQAIADEYTRKKFNALSADERRYVLAAKSDNIPYRGESFQDFIRVVDETERLRANPRWLEELKAGSGGLAGEIRKALKNKI